MKGPAVDETEPEAAFAVNTHGVRALARACATASIKLVHVSTDYVFGLEGIREQPYAEDSPPGPLSVYGASKLAGEYFVQAASPLNLVVRTCGLYGVWGSGGKGGNFVETMLRLAGQGKPLRVVADQRCTPSYTADVAAAIAALITHDAAGVYHVTNSGSCTWFEFTAEILRQSGLKTELTPITTADFGAAAPRPPYSVLACEKLATLGMSTLEPWPQALTRYLTERRAKA